MKPRSAGGGGNGHMRMGMRLDPSIAWILEPPCLNPAHDRVVQAITQALGVCASTGMDVIALQQVGTFMIAALAWARTGLDVRPTDEGYSRAQAGAMVQCAAGVLGGEFGQIGQAIWAGMAKAVGQTIGEVEDQGLRLAAARNLLAAIVNASWEAHSDREILSARMECKTAGSVEEAASAGRRFAEVAGRRLDQLVQAALADRGWNLVAEDEAGGETKDGDGRENAGSEEAGPG